MEFTVEGGDWIVSADIASPGSTDNSCLLVMNRRKLEVWGMYSWRGEIARCRRAPKWAKDFVKRYCTID